MTHVTAVRVTQHHIDAGEQRDLHCCALALAVKDALAAEGIPSVKVEVTDDWEDSPSEWAVGVTQDDAAGYREFYAALDDETVEWVAAFDKDKAAVRPVELELTWTEP